VIHKKEESRVFCATGSGGGVKPDCSPEGSVDKSWEKAGDRDTVSWTATSIQNKNKSPIKEGKNVESFLISNAGEVRNAMKGFGITLDEVVNLGGGAIRGSHITVDGFYGDIEVTTIFPINPDDESEGYIASSVTIVRDDETDNIHYAGVGEPSIHYGTMFPYKEIRPDRDGRILPVGDLKPDKLSKTQKARISSILLERFVESVSVAEGKGFSYAEMLAVGDSAPGSDKGYRLWPQFGFDATVPQKFMRIMPDDIAVTSAGISIPPEGSVRAPRDTIIKGLRARVKDLTIQQLISTPEGKRWWEQKGGTVDLRLDLKDKASPGYQRFLEKKAQVERLKKRNETRSLADLYDEIMSQRAFCPNGEGGGVTNDCSSEEGGGGGTATAPPASDTIRSGSTVPITSGRQWKKADDIVSYSGKDIPAKPLKDAESVAIVHGKLLDSALKDIGLTLDQAAGICAATVPGAVVVAMHGTLKETEEYFDDPENADNSSSAATFFSKVDIDGIDNAVAIGTTIVKDEDDRIVLSYGMLDVVDEAKESSPIAVARAMYRGVAESINAAEKAGVEEIVMFAAGGKGDTDRFSGYRIWPRLGFDAVIPRSRITPVWSPLTGFFNSYGSSIPDRILSPRALAEKKEGLLTIQALYETREGQDWWEKNGGPMVMTMQVGDKSEPGWQRFLAMRDKATRRSLSNDEFFEWLDFEWRHIVEQRGFCPNGEGGGVTNTCSSQEKMGPDKDSGGGAAKSSKQSKSEVREPLAWKPGDDHPDAFDAVRQSPPMTRGPDGKMTSSEYSREDKEITSFAGKEFASVEAVSRHLLKATAETRGRTIDTKAKGGLSGDEMEYMVSSLAQQVSSAQARGHQPLFYSADELKAQTDYYTQIHPVLKGGMTASGICIGSIGSDGSCSETDSITPEGEFLFRAIQALTSPQANPDINMQRADQALTHFLTEPDPNFAGLENAPYFMDMTHQGFVKLQKIIDKVGLTKTAEIFNGPPMRRNDIEKFFNELGISGVSGTKQYAADEVVPMFCVFGPKVGTFFSNNNGNLEPLTADVWFTRTWTRLSGELLKETSPDTAKKHARELLKPSLRRHLTDQDLGTTPVEELISGLQHMQKTGEIPAVVEAWATARFKRYGKEGFAKRTEKKFGKQYTAVGDLSRSVLDNLLGAVGDPQGTVQRSNMIKVMKEVSKRTGTPVAHCQDLLWQDEQDIWAAAGARTFTEVGDVSLYSTGIQKMVTDPSKRRPLPERKAPKKKVAVSSRSGDYDLADEGVLGVGDIEQMTFADAMSGIDPDAFADAFVKVFGGEADEERRNFAALDFGIAAATAFVGRVAESFGVRAFCPTGDGGGVKNDCGADSHSMPKSSYDDPKNKTSWMSPSGDFYPVDRSKDIGGSRGGNTHEDWALANGVSGGEASLLEDGWIKVSNSGKTLYLKSLPGKSPSTKQLSSAKDFAIASNSFDDVVSDSFPGKQKTLWSSRAFCPTGDGGGLDNSCGANVMESPDSGSGGGGFKSSASKTFTLKKSAKTVDSGSKLATNSWVSPSGDFYPVGARKDSVETHEEWAEKNVSLKSGDHSESDDYGYVGVSDSLLKAGWLRVSGNTKTVYVQSGRGSVTGKQKSALKDMAIQNEKSDILLDEGSYRLPTKTLWSSRAFCPTGDGGGVDNSCSAESSSSTPGLHVSSVKLTSDEMFEMVRNGGSAGEDVDKAMGNLKTAKRFELVGAITQSMPLDSSDAGEFASRTVESAAAKGKPVPEQLSRQIADAVEGIYGSSIQYAKDNRIPRGEAINQAALVSACFIAQVASGVKEFPEIVNSPVEVKRRQEIFDMMIADGTPPHVAADLSQGGAAFYAGKEDRIVINADNAAAYIDSILAAAASELNEDTGKWESASGGVPFYSTSQLGHSLVHENGHMIHYRAIRDSLGIPHGKKLNADESRLLEKSLTDRCKTLLDHLRQSPATGKKLKNISGYAMSNPIETVAEYYTSLALGVAKRDSDLDEVMVIMGFPADRLPPGKKGAKKK
jgi:hypothetical protein